MAKTETKYPGPDYKVLFQLGRDAEVRQYSTTILAQVEVAGRERAAMNEGFRILAAYIFGKNTKKSQLSMTTPVVTQPEKLPMTAPVTVQANDTKTKMSFFMPPSYTLQTLPEPVDSRIHLVEVPGQRFAAIRFSGCWDAKLFAQKANKLLDYLRKNHLEQCGAPVNAYYNSPFSLPFLRRNEVLVPLAD